MRLVGTLLLAACATLALARSARAHQGIGAELEKIEETLRVRPHDVDALLHRATLHRLAGAPAHAAEDATRARALAPNDARPALALGLALHDLGIDDEARAELQSFLRRSRGTREAWGALADIERTEGRTAEAIDAWRAAIALEPRPDEVLLLARLQVDTGDLEGAARTLEDGLARLAGAVVVRRTLIDVEARRGHTARALALIDEVLPALPVPTTWLLLRADVLAAAGRVDEARADRRRALQTAERALARRPTAQHRLAREQALAALRTTGNS